MCNYCNHFSNPLNENECIDSCARKNKFYYNINKKCLDTCNDKDKVVEDINQCVSTCNNLIINKNRYYLYEQCGEKLEFNYTYDKHVTTCPEDKPYINMDLNKCVDLYPDNKKYYVSNYIHSRELLKLNKKKQVGISS